MIAQVSRLAEGRKETVMATIARPLPRWDIKLDTTKGEVLIEQRWKYTWLLKAGASNWTRLVRSRWALLTSAAKNDVRSRWAVPTLLV